MYGFNELHKVPFAGKKTSPKYFLNFSPPNTPSRVSVVYLVINRITYLLSHHVLRSQRVYIFAVFFFGLITLFYQKYFTLYDFMTTSSLMYINILHTRLVTEVIQLLVSEYFFRISNQSPH